MLHKSGSESDNLNAAAAVTGTAQALTRSNLPCLGTQTRKVTRLGRTAKLHGEHAASKTPFRTTPALEMVSGAISASVPCSPAST